MTIHFRQDHPSNATLMLASLAPHQIRMVVSLVYTVTIRIYHLKWSSVAVWCFKVCMDIYPIYMIAMPGEMPLASNNVDLLHCKYFTNVIHKYPQ